MISTFIYIVYEKRKILIWCKRIRLKTLESKWEKKLRLFEKGKRKHIIENKFIEVKKLK